jgi:1-phosphofructokinase family hexose kinase
VILTVTPNPALDVTYDVERLVPHASHRVLRVREVAGGKGLNVASVLAMLGHDVLATGLVGGGSGAQVRADLDGRGIRHELLECAVPTRRTVTVVSAADGEATAFNEPGEPWSAAECERLAEHVDRLVRVHRPRVVVASGSVPPGFGGEEYAALVRSAHAAGCAVVLDASGDALLAGVAAGPDVVKPNRDELHEVTGEADPVRGATVLQDKGARHVVVSLGADGMVHVAPSGGGTERARLGEVLRGNPTGAGDAAVAAIAVGLAEAAPWGQVLAEAVAWSAAAVLQPVAGTVSPEDVRRLRSMVTVEREEP